MFTFKLKAQTHDATIDFGDRSKIPKERMVARVQSVRDSLALDKRRNGGMSRGKKNALRAEVRGILAELGAREEALDEIVRKITD